MILVYRNTVILQLISILFFSNLVRGCIFNEEDIYTVVCAWADSENAKEEQWTET